MHLRERASERAAAAQQPTHLLRRSTKIGTFICEELLEINKLEII